MKPISGYTILSARRAFEKGETTPERLFNEYRSRIEKENSALNAFLNTKEFSFNKSDKKEASQLSGIPYAAKDNLLVKGTIATGGSKILENYQSAYDAEVVTRLADKGAQLLGKTNMDEFAMGSSGENSAYGPTKNPHNHECVPGGSSAGSAAAVAADLCVFALGSDTGGSIRQPAAFCGVVGFKPSYGRVSRHGLMALASSLDQIGPFTKTVDDTALVFSVISGKDIHDSTTVNLDGSDVFDHLHDDIQNLRIGVPEEYFGDGLSDEVRSSIEKAIDKLIVRGAKTIHISLPHSNAALAAYYIIQPSEASANLARYDGIRYGFSDPSAEMLLDVYNKSRANGFGEEVTRRIILGTFALSAGYFDAYYLKAQRVRSLIRKDFDEAFKRCDVIIGPTTPTTAFRIGEKSDDPLSMDLSDIYTVPVNLAGIPAISIPCTMGDKTNMPVGLQIIGPMMKDEILLRVAWHIEQTLLNE